MVKPALDGNYDGSQFSGPQRSRGFRYANDADGTPRVVNRRVQQIRRVFAQAAAAGLADRYVSALLDPDTQHQKAKLS